MIEFGCANEICMNTAPFVQSICDTEDNILRIQVVLSRAGEKGSGKKTGNAGIDDIINHCRPIYPDNNYR